MYGAINKRSLTHEVVAKVGDVAELYVDPNFSYFDSKITVYVKEPASGTNVVRLLYKLQAIWGWGNVKLYTTREFDSALLSDCRLIYSNGRWYDV